MTGNFANGFSAQKAFQNALNAILGSDLQKKMMAQKK